MGWEEVGRHIFAVRMLKDESGRLKPEPLAFSEDIIVKEFVFMQMRAFLKEREDAYFAEFSS